MIEPLRSGFRRVLELIFPSDCEHCGEAVEDDSPWKFLCQGCAARIDWISGPVCETCGHPFPGIEVGQACEHCAALDPAFSSGRCCVLHREVGASLVRGLKYRRGRYLLGDIARMAASCPDLVEHMRGVVLVPVPLHRDRERQRGFNQSLALANAMAKTLPAAGVERLLQRRNNTVTQTRLPREERMKNVRGAFVLRRGMTLRADLTYVVVDDVFTTGSTMNECARTLRTAGAESLKVMAFAHG